MDVFRRTHRSSVLVISSVQQLLYRKKTLVAVYTAVPDARHSVSNSIGSQGASPAFHTRLNLLPFNTRSPWKATALRNSAKPFDPKSSHGNAKPASRQRRLESRSNTRLQQTIWSTGSHSLRLRFIRLMRTCRR